MEKETPDIYILEELDLFVRKMMRRVARRCKVKLGYDQVLQIIHDDTEDMMEEQ